MNKETEQELINHLKGFPERQETLNELLLDIQRTNAHLVAFVQKAEESRLFENLANLQPWADLTDVLSKLNKLLKWGGLTFFAFLGLIYLFFTKK